ncbi:hypothetical protein BGZ47_004137 [Haplosporangium gracile]|nr:hypothetical protein BGZ47_004137 [Haplosporangium gracile]
MTALAPNPLDQQQQQQGDSRHSPITPRRSPSPLHRRRANTATKDLSLGHFFSSSSSSLSSDQAEEGMESPLTSSSMATSPTQSSASRLPSFESGSSRSVPPAQLLLAPPAFLSPPTSPASSISPTSPLRIAFSSPRNHRNDPFNGSTTFASFHNQLSPDSKKSYIAQRQGQQQDEQFESSEQPRYQEETCERPTLFRSRSHSQPTTPTIPSDPPRFSISGRTQFFEPPQHTHQSHHLSSPPPQPRRMRVSTECSSRINKTCFHSHTALCVPARQHHLYSTLPDGGNTNGNNRTSQQIYTSPSYQPRSHLAQDSKTETPMIIPIHVRYVLKDLWVQVDLPRDMPVHKVRDLILSKCRLTSVPLQTPTTSSVSTASEAKMTSDNPNTIPSLSLRARDLSHFKADLLDEWHQDESPSLLALHCDVASSPSRNHRLSCSTQDDESFNDQESIDDDEAELRAEELIVSDLFGQSPSSRTTATTGGSQADSISQGLLGIPFASSRVRDDSQRGHSGDRCRTQSAVPPRPIVKQHHQQKHQHQGRQQHGLSQQQINRLISYSTLHKNDGHGSAIGGDKHGKDGISTKRFSNIPGWAHYRSRQNSNNSKHIDREVLDHGGMLADHCLDEENPTITEARSSECTAWKACFGIFWLAAGHWLDDSRLVSSYNLQPHCLLELQLRNNYISLPPPGTPLSYYDHYAEGLLYKKSKKGKLGQGNKECAWKERWVVLQGNRLFIYHKRKDTTTKSEELTPPLTIITSAIPPNARHSFKLTSPSIAMSSSMVSIFTSQDPTVPVVCFRASSERAQSLDQDIQLTEQYTAARTASAIRPEYDSIVNRSAATSPTTAISATTSYYGPTDYVDYQAHTSQSASATPSINPVLISNAAAALSNLHHGTGGSNSNSGTENNGSEERQANYSIAELKYRLSRSSYSSNGFGYKNLHQLERQALSRNSSLSSYRTSVQSMPGELARQRTSTEPGYLSRMRGMISQRSSQQMLRDQIRRSTGSAPEPLNEAVSVAEQASNNLGDILLLEPSVQALLKSSGAVLYSGYIWLYIPHDGGASKKDDQDSIDTPPDSRRAFLTTSMSRTSSTSSAPTATQGSRAANICITKASGRYVKCFAVINDQGRFQWTEVRKQEDSDTNSLNERQSDSPVTHPRFGFPLTSTRNRCKGALTTDCSLDEDNNVDSASSNSGFKPERTVEASMAHKLRLYFFCIKISTSSAGDIIVEFMESPSASSARSSSSGSPPARSKKSPLREKNSLSALPRTRAASSPLPPLPDDSFQTKFHARSDSVVPSFGRFTHLNPPVWPSMSPLHERSLPPTPMLTPPVPEILEIPKFPSTPSSAQGPPDKRLLTRTPSLFVENRSRSAPPGSIFPTAASLSKHSSYSGLLRNVILATSANITPEQMRPKHHSYSKTGTPDMMLTPEFAPLTTAMSPSSASNVLSLAEDLQKALQTRQEPSDSIDSRPSQGPLGSPLISSPMRQTKPTLSEITFKKRASIQLQEESLNTALNVERSRLKLIGVLNTLEEGCEVEEPVSASRVKAAQEEQMEQEASRTAAAALLRVLLQCPFLEQSEARDSEGRLFMRLKGYTETETEWKALQKILGQFLDGPIKDQRSALPPEDTLIPSYHAPRAPELRLSEKAQSFLRAKDRANAAAAVAAVTTLVGVEEKSSLFVSPTHSSLQHPPIRAPPTALGRPAAAMIIADLSTSKPMSKTSTQPTLAVHLTRSGSFSQCPTPEGFQRHSIPPASGTGYSPGKSFRVLLSSKPNGCSPVAPETTPV